MDAPNFLGIGWWNTSLSPRGRPSDVSEKKWSIAETVVRSLVKQEAVDLLGLGEVSPADVERLKQACSAVALRSITDDRPLNAGGRDLGILFRPDKLSLLAHAFISDSYDGKQLAAGLEMTFQIKGTLELLRVFAVHWPSRMYLPAEQNRRALGEALQRRIDGWPKDVALAGTVVLGDFNDEPFDDALSHALLGSRDRNLVRSRPARLYNPFWALLGERQALEEEGQVGRFAAGTYHYRSSAHTHWHTFDQVLVSASLLGKSHWRLLERATRVWQAPPLMNERGRPVAGFDHLPVATALTNTEHQSTVTETP